MGSIARASPSIKFPAWANKSYNCSPAKLLKENTSWCITVVCHKFISYAKVIF